jgi:hypothetical protein
MSPYKEDFINYFSIDLRPITAADNRIFYAIGVDDLKMYVPNGEEYTPVIARNALHAPDMAREAWLSDCRCQ